MSIQDRIAALNLGHVGRDPASNPAVSRQSNWKPSYSQSITTEDVSLSSDTQEQNLGNQPAYRKQVTTPVRAEPRRVPLPPPRPSYSSTRTSSQQTLSPSTADKPGSVSSSSRRDSGESFSSTVSARSSVSGQSVKTNDTVLSRPPSGDRSQSSGGYRVPAYDPASLPALPPKKSEQQKRPSLANNTSSNSIRSLTPVSAKPPPPLPQRPNSSQPPPALPPRRESSQTPPAIPRRESTPNNNTNGNHERTNTAQNQEHKQAPTTDARSWQVPRKSALSFGLNKATQHSTTEPKEEESHEAQASDLPPPIPTASRPDLASLLASKPKPNSNGTSLPQNRLPSGQRVQTACLKCRDFSSPDNHAARFPRHSINPNDVAGLSRNLTQPFHSATDKARAIFTWLHHNIAYDTEAFFSGNLKPATTGSTISTGLAVCEGYAGLFCALAIAAGLECIVISGHGAGFGFTPIAPSQPTPPFDSNHAWNAVRIDNGEWKLVEPCWGAGHLEADQKFHKQFHPECFTMDNSTFGRKHFPTKPEHFLRTDGSPPPSWREYISGGSDGPGETVSICGGVFEKHGLDSDNFLPRKKQIPVRGRPAGERVQFLMSTPCEHWDASQRLGKPYVFFLAVQGGKEHIPFETDDKRHWWCDVTVEKLGRTGQQVTAYAVSTIDGRDAKGVTVDEYRRAKGRKAMSWEGVAMWQLS